MVLNVFFFCISFILLRSSHPPQFPTASVIMQQVEALGNPGVEGCDLRQPKTPSEEEYSMDLWLGREGFELSKGDRACGDTHHRGVHQRGRRVAAGEAGDKLGIGHDLLIGGDSPRQVWCHTRLQLRQSICRPWCGRVLI